MGTGASIEGLSPKEQLVLARHLHEEDDEVEEEGFRADLRKHLGEHPPRPFWYTEDFSHIENVEESVSPVSLKWNS